MAHVARSGRRIHRRAFGLFDASHVAMLGAASGAGVAALAVVAFILWPRPLAPLASEDLPSLPITVAGVAFNVPPAAIRVPLQRRPGAQERIDLAFLWPSLVPPDPAAKPKLTDEPAGQDRLLVSIVANSGIAAPADLITTIYPRYLDNPPREGPPGLTVLPFRKNTPYQGEDLVYASASQDTFAVRCSRATATPGICLLDRRVGAADITVRFPRDWLIDWRELARGIDRLIASLRPAGS